MGSLSRGRVSVQRGFSVHREVSVQRGVLGHKGSLCQEVIVSVKRRISVRIGSLSGGDLCQKGVSERRVQRDLCQEGSGGLCWEGILSGVVSLSEDPPYGEQVGGTHRTGMLSCNIDI